MMQNTFRENLAGLRRKILTGSIQELLHLAWQSGKEHGL